MRNGVEGVHNLLVGHDFLVLLAHENDVASVFGGHQSHGALVEVRRGEVLRVGVTSGVDQSKSGRHEAGALGGQLHAVQHGKRTGLGGESSGDHFSFYFLILYITQNYNYTHSLCGGCKNKQTSFPNHQIYLELTYITS